MPAPKAQEPFQKQKKPKGYKGDCEIVFSRNDRKLTPITLNNIKPKLALNNDDTNSRQVKGGNFIGLYH